MFWRVPAAVGVCLSGGCAEGLEAGREHVSGTSHLQTKMDRYASTVWSMGDQCLKKTYRIEQGYHRVNVRRPASLREHRGRLACFRGNEVGLEPGDDLHSKANVVTAGMRQNCMSASRIPC